MKGLRSHAAAVPRLLAFAAALAAAGCASGGRPTLYSTRGTGDQVLVTVENQNFKDADVFARWEGQSRDRLGMVTGNTTQTFSTPARSSAMRIEVDFIAGDDYVTESLGVFEGDHIQVTIPPSAD